MKGRARLAVLLTLGNTAYALAMWALCRDAAAAAPAQTREAMNIAIIGLAFAPYAVGAVAAWALLPALRVRVRAWFS
jgi:hypothetical protein